MIAFFQNLVDALSLGSIYALTALGIGLLFGILRLVNMAHGDFITVGAYALIVPSTADVAIRLIGGWHWALLIPAVCVVVVTLALIADVAVFRPLRRASEPTLMAASFGVSYIIQYSVQLLYSAQPKSVDLWSFLGQPTTLMSLEIPRLNLVTIATTFGLLLLLTLFLKRTETGVQMRASAENFQMASYLGVRANRVVALAFAISGILAATASLLFISQTGTLTHTLGQPIALFAFVATVVGGMGSLLGAVIGGFTIGIVVTMLQAYLPPDLRPFRDAFAFTLVVAMLLVRPHGLIRAKGTIHRV